MAFSTSDIDIPRAIPNLLSDSGLTYTGIAPLSINAFMALLCTFLGIIILSPSLHVASIIVCTAEVVPPTMKNACSAPNASAASSSASLITDTGWHRLSKGFIEFTSTDIHFSPRKSVSSLLAFPCLCPGTSNGTILSLLNLFNASYNGILFCSSFISVSISSMGLSRKYYFH